jgi:hypothetical protein
VAALNDGTFIIGDGYCNSRAVRFLANGTYHSQFQLPEKNGSYDIHNNPGGSGIGVVHSVAFDECDGMVYVADKENGRVHTFDLNTRTLICEWQHPQLQQSLCCRAAAIADSTMH